jgi:hypothetical protein
MQALAAGSLQRMERRALLACMVAAASAAGSQSGSNPAWYCQALTKLRTVVATSGNHGSLVLTQELCLGAALPFTTELYFKPAVPMEHRRHAVHAAQEALFQPLLNAGLCRLIDGASMQAWCA